MNKPPELDVRSAAARRRFYLSRARRLNTRGAGSDMDNLMEMPRTGSGVAHVVDAIFGDISVFLIDAFAVAAYAPERLPKDVCYFVAAKRYGDAQARLRAAKWNETRTLAFPDGALGLFGSAWTEDAGRKIDLLTSEQAWGLEAFAAPVSRDANGERVIPVPYLVLMKLDSARGIDQADLARILGRLSSEQVDDVIRIVERHYSDPSAADDVWQYHENGKREYETVACDADAELFAPPRRHVNVPERPRVPR